MAVPRLVMFLTLSRKESLRFLYFWAQSLLPSIVTTSLYFVIFGHIMGRYIGKVDDVAYIDFIVPGLVLMSVITNAYMNTVSSFFFARYIRSIEELLVSPMSDLMIVSAYVMGGLARSALVGTLVMIVAFLFTGVGFAHPVVVLATFLLTAILFSLAGIINAVFARNFDDISIVPTFVLTPLIYLGGVFYSAHQLTPFWQGIVNVNPIANLISLFRYGILGVGNVNMGLDFLMLGFVTLVVFAVCYTLVQKGVGIRT